MYNIEELKDRLLSELKEIAEELGVTNFNKLSKQDLIYKILDQQAITPPEKLPKRFRTPARKAQPVEATADATTTSAPAAPVQTSVFDNLDTTEPVIADAPAAEQPVTAPVGTPARPIRRADARNPET